MATSKSAIEQYKKIIGRAGANREVVAKALVRLGACYEKQGNGEARKSYERVVREFADQAEAAQEARAHLSAATPDQASGLTNHRVWAGANVPGIASVSGDGQNLSDISPKRESDVAEPCDQRNAADRKNRRQTSGRLPFCPETENRWLTGLQMTRASA